MLTFSFMKIKCLYIYIYPSGESGVVGVYVSTIGSFTITLVQYKGLIGTGGVIGFLRNTVFKI